MHIHVNNSKRAITFLGYIIAILALVFGFGNIYSFYWIKDSVNSYPFFGWNWQVSVKAYLCIGIIMSILGFITERFFGLSDEKAIQCAVGGMWFSAFLCTMVALSIYTVNQKPDRATGERYGYGYSFGWVSCILHFAASVIYAAS